MLIEHVILDRDGVLNREDPAGPIVDPTQWVWEPGALEALRRLAAAGVGVSVATNQSIVGRGGATLETVDRVHRRMLDEACGAIGSVYVCPHAPEDGCDCRKPREGLILQALRAHGAAAERTLVVGDDARDLLAGLAAGTHVALVRTGKGRRVERTLVRSTRVFDDVLAVACWIVGG